uniref:FERM domain-containing protein n=1 Tax=Heterorhabditis bacteriophora TaxID=37862 RepID=A0A1I7WHN0_HETBA
MNIKINVMLTTLNNLLISVVVVYVRLEDHQLFLVLLYLVLGNHLLNMWGSWELLRRGKFLVSAQVSVQCHGKFRRRQGADLLNLFAPRCQFLENKGRSLLPSKNHFPTYYILKLVLKPEEISKFKDYQYETLSELFSYRLSTPQKMKCDGSVPVRCQEVLSVSASSLLPNSSDGWLPVCIVSVTSEKVSIFMAFPEYTLIIGNITRNIFI